MRSAALLVCVIGLVAALPGSGAEPDIAFETISLTHLRAGEIAPLLAPHFRYAGELPRSGEAGPPADSSGLLPEGVKLITASHHSSRCLLVAGTARAVADVREIVGRFDVDRRSVQLTVKVYPSLAEKASGWHDLPAQNGVDAAARTLAAGERLRFPALPRGFEPQQILVRALDSGPEFVPLPPLRTWPQVLLCLMPHIRAGSAVTLYFGVGLLQQSDDPTQVVKQAWDMSAAQSLSAGESLALRLARGNSGITVVITPAPPAG
jgi:hypothetical protein